MRRYEYMVLELRERLLTDTHAGNRLERTLNEHAAEGWQVKAITPASVRGRSGLGSRDALLITLERPVA